MIRQQQFGDVTAVRLSWPRSQFAGYGVHVFVVRGVLVDSGFPGVARAFATLLDTVSLRGAFITHHHEDHAGNVELLAGRGIPLALDANTATLLRSPAPIALYRHFMWKATPPLRTSVTPFADTLLSLVPTPGHCADHHSVWDASTGTLFAGDLFLGVRVRFAHATEHPRQQVQSLRDMASRQPERVFCAHRGFLPHAARALTDKANWMEEVITRAERRMDAGLSDRAIRQELLGALGPTHVISAGHYSSHNLIVAIRRTRHIPLAPTAAASVTDAVALPAVPPAADACAAAATPVTASEPRNAPEPHAHQ